MSPGIRIAFEIAMQAALIALFLGSLFTLIFGVGLVLGNRWVFALNERTKRWVSTREAMRPADVSRSIDPWLYRQHLPIGAVLGLGSLFILYVAFFHYDMKATAQLFQAGAPVWVQMIVQAGWWIAVIAAVAGLVVGALLGAKPFVLQAAEAWANRSYSGRRATKPLEVMNFSPDRWITSSPKWSGAVIAIGSLYIAAMLGQFLVRHL